MDNSKFNVNEYATLDGKLKVNQVVEEVVSLFNDVNEEGVKDSNLMKNKLDEEILQNSGEEDSSFKILKPEDGNIFDLKKMVEDYEIYNKGPNRELTGKWKKYIEYVDYRSNDSIRNSIEILNNQHSLIRQIPENRIQSKKHEMFENMQSQNKKRDPKERKKLLNKFEVLSKEVDDISNIEKISDTSMMDVQSYRKLIDLEKKTFKSKKLFYLISSISFLFILIVLSILILLLLGVL
ncbi:MAG: hypothetical protein HRS57_03175 [Mycoplasmataceae bacterium]|nr:hypothetical protein [Mycoplasmataceae bacterium]